jgi:hypothetical protein
MQLLLLLTVTHHAVMQPHISPFSCAVVLLFSPLCCLSPCLSLRLVPLQARPRLAVLAPPAPQRSEQQQQAALLSELPAAALLSEASVQQQRAHLRLEPRQQQRRHLVLRVLLLLDRHLVLRRLRAALGHPLQDSRR